MRARVLKRCVLAAGAMCLALVGSGCAGQGQVFAGEEGQLFWAQDVLALPGEQVPLRARLQGGDLLGDRRGYLVRFVLDGQVLAVTQTDREGYVQAWFTPPACGDYRIEVQLSPVGWPSGEVPPPADLLVQCRPADQPMLLVDMDKTVVKSDFRQVLLGRAQPMPDAARVMNRLAQRYWLVYFTQRPQMLGPSSKGWLKQYGFPRSVLLLSKSGMLMSSSSELKQRALEELRKRFTGLELAIDDRIEDAPIYLQAGMRAIIVLPLTQRDDPKLLAKQAGQLEQLDPNVDVVTDWTQLEQAVFDGMRFTPQDAARQVRDHAWGILSAPQQGEGGQ